MCLNSKVEYGAFINLRFGPNLPAHQLYQLFAHGQAKTCAAMSAFHRSIKLAERLKDVAHLIKRYSYLSILDCKMDLVVAAFKT